MTTLLGKMTTLLGRMTTPIGRMTTPVGKMTTTFLLVFCIDFVGKMHASPYLLLFLGIINGKSFI